MPDMTALGFAVASTVISSFGLVFLKNASGLSLTKMIFSRPFIAGGITFLVGGVLLIMALKTEELAVVFPLTSLTYIWVAALSRIYLKEKINVWKITSIICIIIGILFISM